MITEIEHPDGTRLIPFEGGWKVEAILEKNKWYKNKEYKNLVFYHSNNNNNYGFTFYTKKWSNDLWFELDSTWLPASEEEVKDALIKEAERRGYKEGVMVNDAHYIDYKYKIRNGVYFYKSGTELSLIDDSEGSGNFIFYNGKWAEIISNPNEKILERIATIEKELEQLKSELK